MPTTTPWLKASSRPLECELIARRTWKSKAEAKTALFRWIEGWYNPRRLHSSLGYKSPNDFEEKYCANNDRAPSTGLSTAAVGSSQAPAAAVDNPASVNV
jgi:putative transposase